MDSKKANNMLEFLYDPTVIPVLQRLYFRREENLQNEQYEGAKADAVQAYRNQNRNSDFYPSRNRQQSQREASVMDRKTMIASLDVIAQNFSEDDPIGKDLRTMAYALSKMSDDGFATRTAAKTFKCPTCGTKVLEQTKFCVKCKKKVKPPMGKTADQNSPHPQLEGGAGAAPDAEMVPPAPEEGDKEDKEASVELFGRWNKKATDAVRRSLIAESCGEEDDKDDKDDKSDKSAAVPHDESKETPKEEAAETPAEQSKEKAMGVEKHDVKAGGACEKCGKNPCECKAALPAPAAPAAPAPAPTPVQAAEMVKVDDDPKSAVQVKPEEAAKEEGKEAKIVDTSILNASQKFGDIEMGQGMVEAGEMTDDEKAKLDLVLRFAGLDDMKVEDKAKLGLK